MPTYMNDADISTEYTTSIEIRGPPDRKGAYSNNSELRSYASSDEFLGASEGVSTHQLKGPDLPGLELVNSDVDNLQGQVIYLDFDGEQDVTYNGPVVVEGIDIPEFSADVAGLAGQERGVISQVLSSLEQQFEGTGIIFTITKPDTGTIYSTVFIGGDGVEFRAGNAQPFSGSG